MRLALTLATLLLACLTTPATLSAQVSARVSVASNGLQAHGGSFAATLSSDGRYVAFESDANDLVPGDPNPFRDVFVHDRVSGITELASVNVPGGTLLTIAPGRAMISGDGRAVAYQFGILLAPGLSGLVLVVRDLDAGMTMPVHTAPGTSSDLLPSLSHDGRLVAYGALQSGINQILLKDLSTNATTLVSVSSAGIAGNSYSYAPSISADGRWVAFASDANNLVPNDSNGSIDVFVRDLLAGTTERVSVTSAGAQTGGGFAPTLSPEGRFVGFESYASDLVPGDTNAQADIFLHDRQTGLTQRVNVSSSGQQALGLSYGSCVSAFGERVLFTSSASNLVPNDGNSAPDVFLRDVAAGVTVRVSVASGGAEVHGESRSSRRALASAGRCAAFESVAVDVVAGDSNGSSDIFVRDLALACPPIEAYCTAKVNSLLCLPEIGASGVPSLAGPDSFFIVAERMLGQENGLLAWSLAPASSPFFGGTLCLQPPVTRTPMQTALGPVTSAACLGAYSFHWSQAYMTALQLPAGTTVHAQYWARDPGPGAQGVSLTGGLRFTLCP